MLAIMNVQQKKTTVYSATAILRYPQNLTLALINANSQASFAACLIQLITD